MISRDRGTTFGASVETNPAWDPCNCCTTATTYVATANWRCSIARNRPYRDMYVVLSNQEERAKLFAVASVETSWK